MSKGGAPGGEVRIIGGSWKRSKLPVLDAPGLRPTPDRLRETLFNWLGQDLSGKTCLDLFAGSGALGFEAASRGARRVVMVESDAEVFRALITNRTELDAPSVDLRRAEALQFLAADTDVYDVVFLDPPFRAGHWARLAQLLPPRLAPGALVYYESALSPELPAGWEIHRQGRAGMVKYQLLKRAQNES